jgi:ADP-ribosylation factor-like protein 5B
MGQLISTLWKRLLGIANRGYKIVIVGLNNAGKTTLLYRLNLGEKIETQPTIGCNVEEIK